MTLSCALNDRPPVTSFPSAPSVSRRGDEIGEGSCMYGRARSVCEWATAVMVGSVHLTVCSVFKCPRLYAYTFTRAPNFGSSGDWFDSWPFWR